MESLFNLWNKSPKKVLSRNGESKSFQRVKRYADFNEFLAQHPDCCHINPGGPYELDKPRFLNRILGYDSGKVVSLKFQEKFLDEEGQIFTEKFQIEERLQNCGESRW